jgi:N-acetylmuramic acid 6-phosphate etherase
MKTKNSPKAPAIWHLGLECGGTRTTAAYASPGGNGPVLREFGPANLLLLTDGELLDRLLEVRAAQPHASPPAAIGIGMAGARLAEDQLRVRRLADRVWPGVPCVVTDDLEIALLAGEDKPPGSPRVIILSGTGSCCYGLTPDGRTAKLGGWGHLLGDKGSGYEISLRALKAVVYYLDRDGKWSGLGQRILRVLQLNHPGALVAWAQAATKREIAALAPEVFAAWSARDRIAKDILTGAAAGLAKDGIACAGRLVHPGTPVQFIFAGSILLQQPRFAAMVSREIRARRPNASTKPLRRPGVWGAVLLARQSPASATPASDPFTPRRGARRTSSIRDEVEAITRSIPPRDSDTEQRNPRSSDLDQLDTRDAIRLMLAEERHLAPAILREAPAIERVIKDVVRAFRNGGRLLYVGAGTSGRLGVLDASECPPTFRTPPDLIQGIIAGGQSALWQAVEGAEDDPEDGARAIRFRNVNGRDVVMGIAAGGRTPFVWGALLEARKRKARTVLLCFNPGIRIPARHRPHVVMSPAIGPELLTGSTRLKAGTATKLILNMVTTLAMVRMGKVVSNLMVDLNPSNWKLRDRAIRMVREITGVDEASARRALEKSAWEVKTACEVFGRRKG